MKNLGNIIFFLLLINSLVHANVRATVDETNVELGDVVTYSLHLNGENIKRPNIDTLCGVDVTSTSAQTNMQMINGSYSKSYTLSYTFVPDKNCTIEPIEVTIDGKVQKSNSVTLEVTKAKFHPNADFIVELNTSKKEIYVGEPFDVVLLLKQKLDAEAIDNKFVEPKFKGFWVKRKSNPIRQQNSKYITTKIVYTLAPQRVGKLTISKAELHIAKRSKNDDMWGSWVPNVKWKTYFSNTLDIQVKALPEGINLVGNFNISASITKKQLNQNEALNLTLEVIGDGNLEDIDSFKPYIDGVNVFDEKIVIKNNKLTQKMAFVGDKDFTIPPFSLKFFDPNTKEIKTISTKPIKIKVNNTQPVNTTLNIKKSKEQQTQKVFIKNHFLSFYNLIFYIFGLFSGIVLMRFKPWSIYKKNEKKVSIKEPKKLLVKLLPFKDDKNVQKIIDTLEENIYENNKIQIDKQLLKELLKKYGVK